MLVGVQLEQMSQTRGPWNVFRTKAIPLFGWLGLICTALVEVLRSFAEQHFLFDLLRHLPLQVAWATGTALLLGLAFPASAPSSSCSRQKRVKTFRSIFATMRQKLRSGHRWWIPLFFLFLLQLIRIVPFYFPFPVDTQAQAEPKQISVLSANVLSGNRRLEALASWITEKNPDVLVLVEVGPGQLEKLGPVLDVFPHAMLFPDESPEGMALFSKFAFESRHVVELTNSPPALHAVLHLPPSENDSVPLHESTFVEVWAVHPMPPVTAKWAQTRDRALDSLATQVRGARHPVVLAGDLNATPWSVVLNEFQEVTRLRNAAKGVGGTPTWPTFLPSPFRIPIDHILHSEALTPKTFEVGPEMGSDHLPVYSEFFYNNRSN